MNVTVCVKRVPDTETRIRTDGTGIDPTGVKFIVSPYDEFAIEAALRSKEAAGDGAVSLLSLGEAAAQESLRAGRFSVLKVAGKINSGDILTKPQGIDDIHRLLKIVGIEVPSSNMFVELEV